MNRSIQDAIVRIPREPSVVSGPGCGTPTSLLRGLEEVAECLGGVRLYSGLLLGGYPPDELLASGAIRYFTWLGMPEIRPALASGLAQYLPMKASEISSFLGAMEPDVGFVRTTPPDRYGWVSLGPAVGYSRAIVESSAICIAEVDEALPRTHGHSLVHVSRFDSLAETETPTPEYVARGPDSNSRQIAAHVLELLPLNPVLQFGIGSIPEALLWGVAAADLGDVRFVGMGTDAMAEVIAAGQIPPSVAPRALICAAELMGTHTLMKFSHNNPMVAMYPADGGLHPQVLSQLERLIAINSALEVDLHGQVSAEMIGHRVAAGVGGSADFVSGANYAKGGMTIVALSATSRADEGTVIGPSRIVGRLSEGSTVSLPHYCVDYVVTEYGVARMRGRSFWQRAEALTAIAHPSYRSELNNSFLPAR